MRRNRLIQPTGWSTSQRCRPDKTRQRRIRQPAWALDVG
ncbi:ecotin, partial [Escherichia coli]